MKRFLLRFVLAFSYSLAIPAMAEVTISTISKEVGKEGGAFSVNTGGSGSWTATTSASWLLLNRASGEAGVSCIYTVSANFSADTRSGTIQISDNTFTVYQTGYEATIAPTSATIDYEGGSGTIEVTVDAGVSWSAKANVGWLSVSPSSGVSIGSVTYTIAAYTNGTTPRTGTLTVAGKTFSVTQTGTDVVITPTMKKLGSDVGTFEVTVAALAETAWNVTPNASWISVVDSGYGYGNSTLLVAVGANPSVLPRTGTVSVGNKTLTVTQTGTTNVSLSITPMKATASPVGAYGNVAVFSTPDAPWMAESRSPWITISDGAAGAGNGNTKYVVTANPALEDRTGQIVFKQIESDPDNEVDAGLLMSIPDTSDIATGRRSASKSLGSTFDGTYSVTLAGDPIPQLGKNDWSFSFQFRVGELGAVNRLMTFFGTHAIYSDADDILWFDGRKTGFVVDEQWQRLVFCQDEKGHVQLYAGRKTVELIVEYDTIPIHDFTTGATELGQTFVFGYTGSPSEGFLKNGQFANLQLWGRALSSVEVAQVAADLESHETIPKAIPTNMTGLHFTFNQNCNVGNSSNMIWKPGTAFGVQMSGWSEFAGRHGIRQRAIRSDGTGTIVIADLNTIFPGSYVINNGFELNTERNHWIASGAGEHRFVGWCYYTNYYPFPIICSGPFSSTYSMWIYFDQLPSTSVSIFRRVRVKGQDTDARGMSVNNWAKNNLSFGLNINNKGQISVEQNGTNTEFTGGVVKTGQWMMLTVVGKDQNTITMYLDGQEIGNVASSLSFAFFPPTDNRYYHDGTKDGGMKEEIVPTVQCLTIGGWNGAIDEMTFIEGALTSIQVKALYDATKPSEIIHTVTQGVIEPTVTLTEAVFNAAGGDGCAKVTVAANTQWTAKSEASWISFLEGTNHIGSAEVEYVVAVNPSTTTRFGTLTLAGKTVVVEQGGLWSQLTYDGTVFGETSGSGFISVQVEGDGTWTASSDASWLTLLDTSGHGSAEVMFVVDDFNTAVASRTATVTIAGKTVEITQRGYELSIDPVVADLTSNAGAGEIGITAPIDAVWEAIVTADWITLIGGNMGVGSGTLRYTVADNTTGETRTGKIIISGQEYMVTQHANLTLTALVEGSGAVEGTGDYETNERVSLRAVPAEGYAFTHWSGDAVGVEPEVTIVMDMAKVVTAHFIPEDAAQRLAEEKAAQGGFYTREQLKALAMGDTVIEVDGESGTVDLAVQLLETADLVGGEWGGVDVEEGGGSVNVDAEGKVHIRVAPKGNTAFYRLVNANAAEE